MKRRIAGGAQGTRDMLEDFLITIAKGLSMEPFTLLIMMLLCAIAAYMLAQMVPSPAMIMFGLRIMPLRLTRAS